MSARHIPLMLVAALGAFVAAAIVYAGLTVSVDWIWHGEGSLWGGNPPMWFAIVIPALAGLIVYLMRSRGAEGPGPLDGLSLESIEPAKYPWILGAIIVTMLGGMALGPENAVLVTAGFVGGLAASRVTDSQDMIIKWTGLWALAGLFFGAYLLGGMSVAANANFTLGAMMIGLVSAILTITFLFVIRWVSVELFRRTGGKPLLVALVGGGVAAGLIASGYHHITGETVSLALTSGEQMTQDLLRLGTAGAIALAVLAKTFVYILSLGLGFRGGEYFPAIFIGAGSGGITALLLSGSIEVGAASGVAAGVTYLAQPPWWAAIVLGVAIGFLVGGLPAIPMCVLAALIASFVPRIDPPGHGDMEQESTSPVST